MITELSHILRSYMAGMTMSVLMIIGVIISVIYCITEYTLPAYAELTVLAGCGPTQGSDLSISITVGGFSPNTYLHYKYVRNDNTNISGGFSAGTSGENTVAINVGPHKGQYRVYVNDDSNPNNVEKAIYSSIINLPCTAKHFNDEYYKSQPQAIQDLLGIKSIYNEIKIGDYLVASPRNALMIFNLSNSNIAANQLAAAVLVAKLNIADGGASHCSDEIISAANHILKSQNYNGPFDSSRAIISEDVLNQMQLLKQKIEVYNRIGCVN